MKLLMIIADEEHKEELEVFLHRSGVQGYSEIPHVTGLGLTGPRLGSGAFPKTSAMILSIIAPEVLAGLRDALEEFCNKCGGRVRMISWDVEEIG